MAITVASVAAVVNTYVKRQAGDTRPWTDAQVTQAVTDTLDQLWPDFGVLTAAEASADGTQFIAVPAAFTSAASYRLSRVLVKRSDGIISDKATGFQLDVGGKVFIKTRIASGNILRFYGFTPYLNDASNVPDRLKSALAMRSAGFLWGMLGAELANSELQQTLDSGRVVTAAEAMSQSAYFERRFQDATEREPTRISYAPRAANRGR